MQRAFSLVELSIVLVILGLLTGGILAGQSLIRAAELRSVVTEYQRYTTAVQSFRDRYMAIPGDMATATRFWGEAHATPATCRTTVGTGTQTCNGDGNGLVQTSGVSDQWEAFRFWQHLANAGLIEGNYTGVAGSAGVDDHVIGSNAPASKLSNGGWGTAHWNTTVGSGAAFALDYNHLLVVGSYVANSVPDGYIMRPEEAWNIDTKLDDGKPASGKVIGRFWNNLCTSPNSGAAAATNFDASYRLTNTAVQCVLYFRDAF